MQRELRAPSRNKAQNWTEIRNSILDFWGFLGHDLHMTFNRYFNPQIIGMTNSVKMFEMLRINQEGWNILT